MIVNGRIVYIDPNEISDAKGIKFGNNNNIYLNQEDLNISVDLQVIMPNRDSCGKEVEDVIVNINELDSFFRGKDIKTKNGNSEKVLTDSYTEISYQEIKENKSGDRETLGIKSIDISFDSHFFPIVKMKLIDVRGYSLMQPEQENENLRDENKVGEYTNFFNALFKFPYPRFALTIKGFYGTKATFLLSVSDFTSSFNSQTGNFEVDIDFIGHMYGLYNDIPLNYLMIAPYYKKAGNEKYNKYWQNGISSNGAFLCSDGITPLPTFIEYINTYERIEEEISKIYNNTNESYEKIAQISKLQGEKNVINTLYELYYDLINELLANTNIRTFSTDKSILLVFKGQFTMPSSSKFDKQFKSFEDSSFYYYNNSGISKPNLSDFNKIIEGEFNFFQKKDDNTVIINQESEVYLKIKEKDRDLLSKIYLRDLDGDEQVYWLEINNTFINELKTRKEQLINDINNSEKNANDDIKKMTKKLLSFDPTIENVFRMIFAHLDAFMNIFYGTLNNITKNELRKDINNYNISLSNTDIESKSSKCFLPPFTGFYNDKGERLYPGELNTTFNLEEINLIDGLYQGIENCSNYSQKDTTTDENQLNQISKMFSDFFPIMITDYLSEKNPYSTLNLDEENVSTACQIIIEKYLERLYYYLYETNNNAYGIIKDSILNKEIINLYNAQKNVINKNGFLDELYNLINNKNVSFGNFENVSRGFRLKFNSFDKLSENGFRIVSETERQDDYAKLEDKQYILLNNFNYTPKNYNIVGENTYKKLKYSIEYVNSIKNNNYIGCYFPLFQWKKENLFLGNNIAYGINEDDSNEEQLKKKAFNFLKSIIGRNNMNLFNGYRTSLLRMPKFGVLFLGAHEYIIKENVILGNYLKECDSNKILSEYFENWALNDFKNLYEIINNAYTNDNSNDSYIKIPEISKNKICFSNEDKYKEAQKAILDFYCETVDVIFLYMPKSDDAKLIDKKALITLYNSLKNLINIDGGSTSEVESYAKTIATDTTILEKQEMYYTLKNLCDKWGASYNRESFKLNSPQVDRELTKERYCSYNKNNKYNSEFNSFVFVDYFYRDIKDKFLVDPKILYELLKEQANAQSNRSLLQFMTDIAYRNNLLFITLPVFNNLYEPKAIEEIFKPHQSYELNNTIGNTYVLMYTYPRSTNITTNNDSQNSVGYKKDNFLFTTNNKELTSESIKLFDCGENENEYKVPVFKVDFGKQNQSYFKNITLNMTNPRETEHAIMNKIILSQQGAKGNTNSPVTVGQNMFSVYSKRQYDCGVDMMGCINIMPAMYFQLNNIPIFNGAYIITSVKHHIENGSMTTSFLGTKMSNKKIELTQNVLNIQQLIERIGVNNNEDTTIDSSFNKDNNKLYNSNLSDKVFNVANSLVAACSLMKLDANTIILPNGPYNNQDNKAIGRCAESVKKLIAAGFDEEYKYGCSGYACGKELLENIYGFEVIASKNDKLKTIEDREKWTREYAEPGDIAVMENPNNRSKPGHICMFLGDAWVSDFRQNAMVVYSADDEIDIKVYRYPNKRILPKNFHTLIFKNYSDNNDITINKIDDNGNKVNIRDGYRENIYTNVTDSKFLDTVYYYEFKRNKGKKTIIKFSQKDLKVDFDADRGILTLPLKTIMGCNETALTISVFERF